jgi:hypothetical protein
VVQEILEWTNQTTTAQGNEKGLIFLWLTLALSVLYSLFPTVCCVWATSCSCPCIKKNKTNDEGSGTLLRHLSLYLDRESLHFLLVPLWTLLCHVANLSWRCQKRKRLWAWIVVASASRDYQNPLSLGYQQKLIKAWGSKDLGAQMSYNKWALDRKVTHRPWLHIRFVWKVESPVPIMLAFAPTRIFFLFFV